MDYLETKLVPVPGIEPRRNPTDSVTRFGRCDSVRGRLSLFVGLQETVTPEIGDSDSFLLKLIDMLHISGFFL